MIRINEWMPDPGARNPNQWIELFNDGDSAVNLSGWHIQTTAKKPISISGIIGAKEHKVLRKEDFKFTLRKSEGELSLFDSQNRFIDFASYHGKAIRYESANRVGQATFFAKPTPGKKNTSEAEVFTNNLYPLNVPLPGTAPAGTTAYGTFFGMLLGTAIALAILVVFMFTILNDLQEFLFQRN